MNLKFNELFYNISFGKTTPWAIFTAKYHGVTESSC